MRLEVRMPEPEEGTELDIVELYVSVGAAVAAGDPLMEVATDKANADVVAPVDGVVAELPVAVGDAVPADAPLAVLEVG